MTIILNNHRDALLCITALGNAGRAFAIHRNDLGEFEITTRD